MPGVVCGIVDRVRMREARAEHQEGTEQQGQHSGKGEKEAEAEEMNVLWFLYSI